MKQKAEPFPAVAGRSRAREQLLCAHSSARCGGEVPLLHRHLQAKAIKRQSRAHLAGAGTAGRCFAEEIVCADLGTCTSPSGLTGQFAGNAALRPCDVAFSHAFPQALSQM